mgnify:FL=1
MVQDVIGCLAADVVVQGASPRESIADALGVAQTIIQYAGTVAFAISAALLAGRRRMNVVGVVVFGVLAAIRGGTTRDTLLGDLPVYWAADPAPLFVAAIGGSILNLMLLETSVWPPIASTIAVAFIVILRLLSMHFGWGVPRFVIDRSEDPS